MIGFPKCFIENQNILKQENYFFFAMRVYVNL